MTSEYTSPLGPLFITTGNDGVRFIQWKTGRDVAEHVNTLHKQCHKQLREFFEGKRKYFDLPLQMEGTDFQKEVWQRLLQVEYGHAISYGEISKSLGGVEKSRAVGAAIGANPLMIVIPCHRAVASNEALTGYAGGLKAKEMLLDLESGQLNLFN